MWLCDFLQQQRVRELFGDVELAHDGLLEAVRIHFLWLGDFGFVKYLLGIFVGRRQLLHCRRQGSVVSFQFHMRIFRTRFI